MLQEKLTAYLQHVMPQTANVEVANLWRIPGGASRETWSFDASWHEGGHCAERGFILRRDPDASLLETERGAEFGVIRAAHSAGVPVPEPYWLERDGTWLERPFFIMERIDGCETSPSKLVAEPRFQQVQGKLGEAFVGVLAAIHALDWEELALDFLDGARSPAAAAIHELDRWEKTLIADSLEPQPILRAALTWLRHHLPPPAKKLVVVHADYRTGNFLYNERGEIKGMLDWEMAHIGDPLEDVGWACMRPWRWDGSERIGALMERSNFLRRYAERTGNAVPEESVRFWEVLGNVKLAVIFVTGARSFCEGRTKTLQMANLGRNINRLELELLDLMGV